MSYIDGPVNINFRVTATQTGIDNVIQGIKDLNKAFQDASKSPFSLSSIGTSGATAAVNAFNNVGSSVGQLKSKMEDLSKTWTTEGRAMSNTGRSLTLALTSVISGIGAAGVSAFESFNSQMVQLKRVTQYTGDYALFKKQIDNLSNSFGLSTNAAAGLMTEVASLGVHGADINKMATEVAKFSMVTQTDAQSSLTLYRQIMAVFGGNNIANTTKIMTQLSAIADDTTLNMTDLAQSLPQIGTLMKNMGFDAAGTAAALSSMNAQGIDASEGANALKIVLMKLDDPTKKINAVIKDLGINFFDMSGKAEDGNKRLAASALQFLNMNQESQNRIVSELGPRQGPRILAMMKDMGAGVQELNKITADGIVTSKEAESVQSGWAKAMLASGQVAGYTTDTVDRYNKAAEQIKKDPGTGLKIMHAQFSQISRDLGDIIAPALIAVGDKLAKFFGIFKELPKGIQMSIVGFGALLAAVGPVMYTFGQLQLVAGRITNVLSKVLPANMSIGLPANSLAANTSALREQNELRREELALRQASADAAIEDATATETETLSIDQNIIALEEQIALMRARVLSIAEESAAVTAAAAERAGIQVNQAVNFHPQSATATVDTVYINELTGARISEAEAEQLATEASILHTEALQAEALAIEELNAVQIQHIAMAEEAAAMDAIAAAAAEEAAAAETAAAEGAGVFSMIGGAISGAIASISAAIAGSSILATGGIILIVVAAVGALVLIIKTLADHWDEVMRGMQPGIDALKKGFNAIKDAVGKVIGVFGSVFATLGGAGGAAKETGGIFEGIGSTIASVMSGIGTAMEWIANAISFLKPVFEAVAYWVRDAVGTIMALLGGDWQKALLGAASAVYEIFGRPTLNVLQIIASKFAWLLDKVMGAGAAIAGAIGLGGIAKGLNSAGDSLRDFANNPSWVNSLDNTFRDGMNGLFGPGGKSDQAKPAAAEAGGALGNTLGNEMGSAIASSAGGSGSSWVKDWVSAVYSALDTEIGRIRTSANEAFDKAQKDALKVYDNRIKAIDDQIKAEERLAKTQEYLAKRKELLDKASIDNENYKNARAVAIYEGRIDDARAIDIKHRSDVQASNQSITDLDAQRAKELLDQQRSDLKDQINVEKDAAQEMWNIRKKAFDAYLALITEYAPATVEEFQNMVDQINQILINSGASWPDHAVSVMDRFNGVFADANRKIIEDFKKSGDDAITAWMNAFADPEVIAILAKKVSGGGVKVEVPPSTPPPEQGAFLASLVPSPSSQATPEQIQAWVGSGQGMGGPAESGQNAVHPYYSSTQSQYTNSSYGGGLSSDALNVDAKTQQMVNLIKQQISYGQEVNKDSQYYSIAMAQLAQDAAAAYGSVSNDVQNYGNTVKTTNTEVGGDTKKSWAESLARVQESQQRMAVFWNLVSYDSQNNWKTLFGKTSSSVQMLMEDNGNVWRDVNGKMTDSFGNTAHYFVTANGTVTDQLIRDDGKILETHKKTYTTAQQVFDDMISKGIKPGSAEAQIYVDKINALGGAVATINGESILIPIRLDDWAFWTSIANVNKYLNSLALKNRIIASVGLSGAGITVKDTPDGGFTTQYAGGPVLYYAPGATDANQGQRLATGGMYDAMSGTIQKFAGGGLVKRQKDGILAQIGEGGYNEFVISTDPKYRASSMAYVAAAAAQLGMTRKANDAVNAGYGTNMSMPSMPAGSSGGGSSSNINICVDTFIGEEKWFEEMAAKYNMTIVPQDRKIAGQQRRVVSSYNDRWSIK